MTGICERFALKSGTSVAALSVWLAYAGGALAGGLPSGGHFVAGHGGIGKAGQSLTVKQSSTTGIIDWNSFSVGKHESVTFDNGAGATLNRVTGANLSRIAGSLHATGSVFMLNSSGVIVSGTGHIVTGGNFVASSGNIAGSTFGNADQRLRDARAAIVNRGTIVSGGEASLVGGSVKNVGTITASSVTLRAEHGNAIGGGTITATGKASQGGHILLIAANGRTKVTGALVARDADGSGGSIETSGRRLSIAGRIDAGQGGTWLVDPVNLTIDSTAATTIDTSLNAGTNVMLKTAKNSASGPGTQSSGAGDIIIDSALSWSTTAKLTLDAYHSVLIDAAMGLTGKGTLALLTNDGGAGGGLGFAGGDVTFASTASTLTINGATYTLVNNIATLARDVAKADDGYYALANNYNAKSDGTYTSSPIGEFTGTFEGLGNSISNLTIKDAAQNAYVGLFEAIGFSGTVRDIALTNLSVTGGQDQSIGGLVGLLLGTIEHSSTSGTVKGGDGSHIGGMAGELLNGSIFDSSSAGSVIASTNGNAGGLVGYAQAGVVDGSSSSAALSSADDAADLEYTDNLGGLVGWAVYGTVSNSHATGTITTGAYDNGSSLGGLVGSLQNATVMNSSASAKITAQTDELTSASDYLGGLVGIMTGSTVTGSYASGTVSGQHAFSGGLVGADENGIISTSYATGNVVSIFDIGGLIGFDNGGTITNSYATGNASGVSGSDTTGVGGLVGTAISDTFTRTYATGAVNGTSSALGGLMGEASGINITASFATGAVTNDSAASGGYIGGLIGYVVTGVFDQVYAAGKITPGSANYIGGLVGNG